MGLPTQNPPKSKTKIDVLIPAIEKDSGTLPYVIDAIRKHVKHPIGSIMIVSPNSQKKSKTYAAIKGADLSMRLRPADYQKAYSLPFQEMG